VEDVKLSKEFKYRSSGKEKEEGALMNSEKNLEWSVATEAE